METAEQRDYVDTVIATVRQHDDKQSGWPAWANTLADSIERLRDENHREQETRRVRSLPDRLRGNAAGTVGDPAWLTGKGLVTVRDVLREAADEIDRLRRLCEMRGVTNVDTFELTDPD